MEHYRDATQRQGPGRAARTWSKKQHLCRAPHDVTPTTAATFAGPTEMKVKAAQVLQRPALATSRAATSGSFAL
jgi:hypothetical protein